MNGLSQDFQPDFEEAEHDCANRVVRAHPTSAFKAVQVEPSFRRQQEKTSKHGQRDQQ